LAYTLEEDEVFEKLDSSPEGLDEEEARKRLRKYGLNKIREERGASAVSIFLSQFKSVLIIILLIAAFVSGFVLKELLDMYVILVIVVLNAVIGFIQEYRAEKSIEALKRMVSPEAIVLRESRERRIKAEELVPGDVMIIEEGDRIPADGRLVKVANLRVDEAPLTGESTSVQKSLAPSVPRPTSLIEPTWCTRART